MSDGLQLNAGSGGAVLATDDAGAAGHVQVIKLAVSADGSAAVIPAEATYGLDVDVTRVSGNVSVVGPSADGAAVSGNPVRIAGSDGTNTQDIAVTTAGHVQIHDGGNAITVDGSVAITGIDGPVSLPTGASTEAKQDTIIGHVDGIETLLGTVAGAVSGTEMQVDVLSMPTTPVSQSGTWTVQPGNTANTTAWKVDGSSVTQPVSAASLPLPTGAATAAKQPALGTAGSASADVITVQGVASMTPLKTDGSDTTQPISAASLPLPSGAATAAAQATGNTSLATLAGAVAGTEVRVDVVAPLPTGTNNIGDVDVASLPSIPSGDAAIGRVKLTDGTDVADVLGLTNANPLTVAIVDGDGSQITSFGGGTQYTEGGTDASIIGTAMMWEDTSDTLRVTSASKPLPVEIISGAGSGGTAIQDGAAFTPDTTSLTPIGGYRDDTSPATVTEGDAAAARITEYRALHVNLRDATGNELSVGGGTQYTEAATDASLTGTVAMMEGAADAVVPLQGTATDGLLVNLGANNDVTVTGVATAANQATLIGHVDGLEGLLTTIAGAVSGTEVQVDVLTSALPTGAATAAKQPALGTAGTASADVLSVQGIASMTPLKTDGSATTQPVSNAGLTALAGAISGTEVQVDVVSMPTTAVTGTFWQATQPVSLASVPSHAVTNAGTFATQVDGAALTALQLLDNASVNHDAAAASGVSQVGLEARTTNGTAVASGDATRAQATVLGKQVVKLDTVPELTWSYAAASGGITNTTAATIKAAAGAGIRNYLKSLSVVNGHATVSTEVLVRDGAGGTVLHRGWAQAAGGGYAVIFDPPLRGSADTLLEVVNVTTGSATYVNASGYTE